MILIVVKLDEQCAVIGNFEWKTKKATLPSYRKSCHGYKELNEMKWNDNRCFPKNPIYNFDKYQQS